MDVGFDFFMIGVGLVISQAALYGMFALWLAARHHRIARIVGGLTVVLLGWTSVVPIINNVQGYPTTSGMDVCISTIVALPLGWIAGRNRRLRNLIAESATPQGPQLVFERPVRVAGLLILGLTTLSVVITQLMGFFSVISLVSERVGQLAAGVGLVFAPVTVLIGPLWAGYRWNDWTPAFLSYGSVIPLFLGGHFGSLLRAPEVD